MHAKERKRKSTKERKRAQKGAKERKRTLPRKNRKQPGLEQPGLGIAKFNVYRGFRMILAQLFPNPPECLSRSTGRSSPVRGYCRKVFHYEEGGSCAVVNHMFQWLNVACA